MIQLTDITKRYDNGRTIALDRISLRIARGEIVALMGHSGAGKSTLLNIIGTIDTPTSGQVQIDGRMLHQLRPHHRFRAGFVGFVFQFHHLLPHLTAIENIEVPMFGVQSDAARRRDRASALLDAVGLQHKAASFPNHLSGGERQRIAVARALANAPRIVLADEPTGSVDTKTGDRIMALMVDHCRQDDQTMVVATHSQRVADLTDRVITMENGRLI